MKTIYCKGLPNSGKTTWAKEFIHNQNAVKERWVNSNRKELARYFFFEDKNLLPWQESFLWQVESYLTIIKRNYDVSTINTENNLTLDKSKNPNIIINDQFLQTHPEVLYSRNDMRSDMDKVTRDQLESSFKETLERPDHVDWFFNKNETTQYRPYDKGHPSVIFDLDGTLVKLTSHRGPFDEKKALSDKIHNQVFETLKAHDEAGHGIFIVTGREESSREVTEKWLKKNKVPYWDLFMKPTGSKKSDGETKLDILFKQINKDYAIIAVYEDRTPVVRAWRSVGLTCYQVAQHDY